MNRSGAELTLSGAARAAWGRQTTELTTPLAGHGDQSLPLRKPGASHKGHAPASGNPLMWLSAFEQAACCKPIHTGFFEWAVRWNAGYRLICVGDTRSIAVLPPGYTTSDVTITPQVKGDDGGARGRKQI